MEKIGKYEILQQLGQGAFGRVFKALDPAVGRHVAIKTIEAGGDSLLTERLRQEAMMTAKLIHSHIVTIFEFGEISGVPYIVMELVDGPTLQAVIDEPGFKTHPPTLIERSRMLVEVADGLSYAHHRGVVHRDIKPLNIIRESGGSIKIVDFGLARALDPGGTFAGRTSGAVGTVMYMAPEQITDNRSDKLTDIFSFGVTAYELLSGSHPFPGDDLATVLYRIEDCSPRPIREINAAIPARLAEVVHRCLARERDARYQSIADVHRDLQSVLYEMQRAAADELYRLLSPETDTNIEEVLEALRHVLDLDPAHSEARTVRAQLEARQKEQSQRRRLSALLEEGDNLVRRRLLLDAISRYESAARLAPGDETVRQKLTEARTLQERWRSAVRLVVDGRAHFEAGDLEAAKKLVEAAAEADPLSADAQELSEAIAAEARRRESEQRLKLEIAQIQALLAAGAINEADSRIRDLSAANSRNAEITALAERIATVVAERERQLRQAEFERRSAESQAAEEAGDLDLALELANGIATAFPDQPQTGGRVKELRARIAERQRRLALEELAIQVRSEIGAGRLDGVNEVLKQASLTYGDTSILNDLRRELAHATSERQRKLDRAALLQRTNAGIHANDFSFLPELDAKLAADPEDDALSELRERARTAQARHEQATFVQTIAAQAAERSSVFDWDGAEQIIKTALQRYPGDAELSDAQQLLQKRLGEYRERVDQSIRAVDAALSAKTLSEAARLADVACRQYPLETEVLRVAARAWREMRKRELQLTTQYVTQCLKQDDIDAAEKHLTAMSPAFGSEGILMVLSGEVGQRRATQAALRKADLLIEQKRFEEALRLLNSLDVTSETGRKEVKLRHESIRASQPATGDSLSQP